MADPIVVDEEGAKIEWFVDGHLAPGSMTLSQHRAGSGDAHPGEPITGAFAATSAHRVVRSVRISQCARRSPVGIAPSNQEEVGMTITIESIGTCNV